MKAITFIFLSAFIFEGCAKDANDRIVASEKNAINEVRDIVGDNGEIFIIKKSKKQYDNIKIHVLNDQPQIINIEVFKKLYSENVSDTLPHSLIQISDSNLVLKYNVDSISVRAQDLYSDGPRPAGLYRYSYGPLQNGNSSLLTNLNISFNTNQNGSINGTPVIYFTGIQLFGWQPAQISQISFNPLTYISTFAITGSAVFGIQTSGGLTVGWASTTTFYITINMNYINNNPVTILQRK